MFLCPKPKVLIVVIETFQYNHFKLVFVNTISSHCSLNFLNSRMTMLDKCVLVINLLLALGMGILCRMGSSIFGLLKYLILLRLEKM